jgi:hypothetical protein
MSKYVSGAWILIESHLTDVTGKAQFNYVANTQYQFVITKTGYTTKTFELNPILFATYAVALDATAGSEPINVYQNIALDYTPKAFFNNRNNVINFTIYSPLNGLSQYGMNLSYRTVTNSSVATTAAGSTLSNSINVSGAALYERVNVTYWYTTTNGSSYYFKDIYHIINSNITNTYAGLLTTDYGMGQLEKFIFATIMVMIFAGSAAVVAGTGAAAIVGIIMFGVMLVLGFIPFWAIAIPLVIVVILLGFGKWLNL